MATQFVHDDRSVKTPPAPGGIGTGSILEVLAAAGAAVLAIIGIAGGAPMWLTAIAVIVLGVALLIEGGGVYTRHHQYFTHSAEGYASSEHVENVGSTSSEAMAGIAGVVLGVLSLIGVAPRFLLPISLIIFGGGLLMGTSGGARSALSGSGHAMVGCAAIVLGILALVGVASDTLTLVGLLAVAGALFLTASSIGARFFSGSRHDVAHHVHG